MEIKEVKTTDDLVKVFPVLNELRTNLTLESCMALFAKMRNENYQICYLENDGEVCAVTGYRLLTTLYDGPIMYIDELVTSEQHRCNGYAGKLLDFLIAEAQAHGLKAIHLDSAHHRYDAHRFYLAKKMNIVYHHFRLAL